MVFRNVLDNLRTIFQTNYLQVDLYRGICILSVQVLQEYPAHRFSLELQHIIAFIKFLLPQPKVSFSNGNG